MTPDTFMALVPEFRAPSWAAWRQVLATLTPQVREFYAVVGRGGGKSRIVALLACCYACREYARAPGEAIYVGVFAPDRRQSAITLSYVRGLLRSVPELSALIVAETQASITLSTGVVIEVISATVAAPRGRSYCLAIIEEAAFLPQDHAANPDLELVRALRPALARVKGALLAVVSSPYAKRGVLWQAVQRHAEVPSPDVIVVQAPTLEFNPAFDATAVATAYAEDPASAAAEYGAQFRGDIESYINPEALAACVDPGVPERGPLSGLRYAAFCDPAGGSGADAMTLAVGHVDQDGEERVAVLDALREVRPAFSPEEVVAQFAVTLKAYGLRSVTGDRYAGEWPREAFRRHGITYDTAERPKSQLYSDALPLLNSRRLDLLDDARLLSQIAALERRSGRGRDVIDHPTRGHDDLANAALGLAATMITTKAASAIRGLVW